MKYSITTKNAPEAVGPYSQGTTEARFVFVSGQKGIDPATNVLAEGVEAQTDRAIRNIEAVLSEVDCTLEDVVKTTVFLVSMDDFRAMNEVYARRFAKPAPARSTVEVTGLGRGALVEIECIACR